MQAQNEVATPRERIKDFMARHGVAVTAVFVPWSKSRNKDEKESDYAGKPTKRPRHSLNWSVTVTMPGGSLTTDYSDGTGHCPAYKASVARFGNPDSVMRHDAIVLECETGKAAGNVFAKPIMPDYCDVLSSLALDADVLNSPSFEDWASEYGYDIDSRKAEKTYQACLAIALKLRNGLGEKLLAELREACQDY